jgi:hypothetical protein
MTYRRGHRHSVRAPELEGFLGRRDLRCQPPDGVFRIGIRTVNFQVRSGRGFQ